MHDVRILTYQWSKKTFEEELQSINYNDDETHQHLLRSIEELGIKTKFINGYACEGLPKTEEGRIGIKVNYTDVFHELYLNGDLCPTRYLLRLTELFINNNGQEQKLTGFLSRGMRSLTSFLREPDFAYNILRVLRKTDPEASADLGSSQDAGDHTDVLVKYLDKRYRVWLFQFSDRGLPHDIDRITGRRGELPPGIHLLCPLITDKAIVHDNYLKKRQTLNKKLDKVELQIKICSERAFVKRTKLQQRADNYRKELGELNLAIKETQKECSSELDIINGWYFYSKQHINRIASIIQNPDGALSYKKTVETLEAPKHFLSQPKMFIKEVVHE